MDSSLHGRLLHRETGRLVGRRRVKTIYGDSHWIKDLDIISELAGHNGCVNALSWSKSGALLASGSDDTCVNIHQYQRDGADFGMTTTIVTGHEANIFSVKFMPHSGDRKIVTAAGDAEIRVFDLEYAQSRPAGVPSRSAQLLLQRGVNALTEADTNARVYRSHSDRVKRIVTESSPHLFLSCSEDGEVRQWDLRQPSSAYPRPRGGRGWRSATLDSDTGVPPPLISYKRHQLDLNTISCSASQPHYIALGGAHLHCFLHDRRMLGRDVLAERGSRATDDELMREATQCVRRFAPNGQQRMKRNSSGHITACKISDARPNEMIASWSGDWIYSFDLLRSPDAAETSGKAPTKSESGERKRKRTKSSTHSSGSRTRQDSSAQGVALRVRYANGQSENIALVDEPSQPQADLTDGERESLRIANVSVKVRSSIFSLGERRPITAEDLTGHTASFTNALGFAASILEDMDNVIRAWRYPVDPDRVDVAFQTHLKRRRESARRFVQACGTVARALGGRLQSAGGEHPLASSFAVIVPAPNEGKMGSSEQFCYDFIKAILLWLDSGPGALVEHFSGRPGNERFPLATDSDMSSIDQTLIPYLMRLATSRKVPNVDASAFEVDENLQVFATETAAVTAFANAIKIPFSDLSASSSGTRSQDRNVVLRFWGLRVVRGLLLNAGEGLDHASINHAFGGLQPRQESDSSGDDEEVDSVALGPAGSADSDDEYMVPLEDVREALLQDGEDSDHDDDSGDNDDDDDDQDDDDDDQDGDENEDVSSYLFRRNGRSGDRYHVNEHIPCAPHTRQYRGHCNVKTVKDVNYYGLDDEYIVSGSDCGNVFVWDRLSRQIVQILEGDGEIVNVVQGHPYEPMMAVSGIDHTVKIFGSDARARRDARLGIGAGAASVDDSLFSSVRHGMRRRRARAPVSSEPAVPPPRADDDDYDTDAATGSCASGLASRRRLHDEYRIIAENDEARQGGQREAYITRGMLAELARHMQLGRVGVGVGAGGEVSVVARVGDDGDGGDGDDDTAGANAARAAHILLSSRRGGPRAPQGDDCAMS